MRLAAALHVPYLIRATESSSLLFLWRNTAVEDCHQWAAAQVHDRNPHLSHKHKIPITCILLKSSEHPRKCEVFMTMRELRKGVSFYLLFSWWDLFPRYDNSILKMRWVLPIELKRVQHQVGEKQLNQKASALWHLVLPEVPSDCIVLPEPDSALASQIHK